MTAPNDMTTREDESSTVRQVVSDLVSYDPESDIDLVIIKRTSKRFVHRLVEAGSCIRADVSVDLFVYTPEELETMIEEGNPLIERALTEGKVVYEKTAGDG